MSDIVEKVPPQALEAEQAVLGSMLIERQAIEKAFEWVEEKHFYLDAHRKVFRAVANLFNQSHAVDVVTVGEELRRLKSMEAIGGAAGLTAPKVNSALSRVRRVTRAGAGSGLPEGPATATASAAWRAWGQSSPPGATAATPTATRRCRWCTPGCSGITQ